MPVSVVTSLVSAIKLEYLFNSAISYTTVRSSLNWRGICRTIKWELKSVGQYCKALHSKASVTCDGKMMNLAAY